MPNIGAIGFLIFVAFILCAAAIFTDNWVVYSSSYPTHLKNIGILSYSTANPTWFNAASWMMFISFGLFLPLFVVYLHALYKVHLHGCCHEIRHNLNEILILCSLILILEASAFILFASHVSYNTPYLSEKIGSSAYMALASTIIVVIVMQITPDGRSGKRCRSISAMERVYY